MNALDLPPRRTLPATTRDRIRRTVDTGVTTVRPSRSRTPVAVAAGVVLLAVGAAVVGQSTAGTPDDYQPGMNPPPITSSSSKPPLGAPIQPVTVAPPDAGTTADLDRCGTLVETSPRAGEFAPRTTWEPVFTATAPDGTRMTAFREHGGKPGFCEVSATTVTVADPSAEPMPLGTSSTGTQLADVYGLYLSPSGILAGVGQGVAALEFSVYAGGQEHPGAPPVFEDELFVVNLGTLKPGDGIHVVGRDAAGVSLFDDTTAHDPRMVRPVGATGPR